MKFLRMRPGNGEQLLAEGDPEVAEDEERLIEEFRRQLDAGHVGRGSDDDRDGRREAEMVRAFDEIPRDTERVIFFPRAAGGGSAADAMTVALVATAIVVLALLWEVMRARGSSARSRAAAPRRASERRTATARRLRPRPRAPRRAARPRAPALVRQRGGVGDVPRPRLHPRLGRPADAARRARATSRRAYAYLIYPHKPIVAFLPQTGRLLNEYCVEFPDETRPVRLAPGCPTPTTCSPSGWRSRATSGA